VLVLLDRHFFTEKLARDLGAARRRAGAPLVRLELARSATTDYTLPLQALPFVDASVVRHDVLLGDADAVLALLARDADADADAARAPDAAPGGPLARWLRGVDAPALRVPARELVVEAPLPTIGERAGSVLRYPLSSSVVVSIEHWTHVLWLNQIAFGIRWLELIRRRPLWAAARALSALSLDRERLLARMVARGRGVKIHPTADVSGSILGDGAVIGPHVSVRNSIVGPGAVLLDHASLIGSVVGARALVTEGTFMVSTVVLPEATVGNYKLQVSLVGRGAYVNAWAGFVDAKFVGEIQVQHRGALRSTERAFLGSVVGHRAKVAAKVLVMPGREIPNDAVIVMRPDEIVSTMPEHIEPGRPMVRDRGTLVPLGEETRAR
jgi:acetyltransferase-like isoleucine patch superfamily enzyme